jgi:Glucodextranase, domain B
MTSRRGGRPSQVRPRPPSTGRPAPAKVRARAPAAGRVASHRRVERTRRLALPFRLLFAVAVVALGAGVLFIANGGVGGAAAFLGSSLAGFVDNLAATPAPSAAPVVVASAPVLTSPEEPYTNQPTVDLAGRVPENLVGRQGYVIRIYVAIGDQAPGEVAELPLGDQVTFVVAGVGLSEGTNTFTATISGPAGESAASPGVAYVLDTASPTIKISSPKDGGIVNAKSVEVKGKTQARSSLELTNATTGASVIGAADVSGAFSLIIPISAGVNQLSLTSTDPAGNAKTSTLSVRKGSGALTARLTASVTSIKASRLPETVQVFLALTDPDGQPVAGSQATFSLAAPNVPIISKTIQTDGSGRAVFTTTIPKGAARGQCKVTVIVHTADFGDTNALTIIAITK